MSDDEERGLVDVLKWAGLIALIAVPVYMVLKKQMEKGPDTRYEDEANIFASELED